MSGKVVPNDAWSSDSLPELFRFSPRPNQADKICWQPWGNAAFEEAIRLDKPIFLVISSLWCQWCHIMDETTLSEPTIITIVNNDYIPIRVDSDLRPDVNQRYNQNGWPSIVLLSSEGEILWGGVYVPPKQMLYYLGHIRRYYSEHRAEIAQQVRELQGQRFTRKLTQTFFGAHLRPLLQEERVALEDLPVQAGVVLKDLYDVDYGGFMLHPHLKFPHPEACELLLMLARNGDPDALTMVSYSLEQMRDGGLWDKEAGGFFRYSAASDWSAPHTEKMLDENAALLRLLTLTAQQTQDQQWRDLAKRLILYINTTFWQQDVGIFSGSQSADEDYYEPGPYSRASREAPQVDTTIYTAWNARMISSYLLAARLLNYPSLETMALRALDYLCEHMMHRSGSVCHFSIDGYPTLPGQLADQVWLTRALLDAYELHGRKSYLETAIALMHFACQELLDEQTGLFYDYPADVEAPGRLSLREQPLTENAIAAECLLRMSVHSNRQNLRDTALLVLSGCREKYRRTGIQGAIYACVVAQTIEDKWLERI
ncbi:MAG: thioredoxin domain-containing protein [Ktedonobacteraceae bacterium]|nr:thioredoxin domain-containing protein [Ktedonobacteraceae bacterium]